MGDVVNCGRKERMLMDAIVASSKDRNQFQRAQALQWLDDGESRGDRSLDTWRHLRSFVQELEQV